eukprot:7594615-Prorocentrum_lima.AAC.1
MSERPKQSAGGQSAYIVWPSNEMCNPERPHSASRHQVYFKEVWPCTSNAFPTVSQPKDVRRGGGR